MPRWQLLRRNTALPSVCLRRLLRVSDTRLLRAACFVCLTLLASCPMRACLGWKSWIPPSPLPLDGACQLWAGKDPWKKELPTADNKKHDAVVVSQTITDCTVYAIPGVVGGFAIVDSIIADPDNEEFQQEYV